MSLTAQYLVIAPVTIYPTGIVQRRRWRKRGFMYRGNDIGLKTGDILMHHPALGDRLAVYRAGDLVANTTISSLGIAGLTTSGNLQRL